MGELLKYPRKAVLLVVGSHSIKTGSVSVIRRISTEDKLLTLFCAIVRISSPDLILADAAAERGLTWSTINLPFFSDAEMPKCWKFLPFRNAFGVELW